MPIPVDLNIPRFDLSAVNLGHATGVEVADGNRATRPC